MIVAACAYIVSTTDIHVRRQHHAAIFMELTVVIVTMALLYLVQTLTEILLWCCGTYNSRRIRTLTLPCLCLFLPSETERGVFVSCINDSSVYNQPFFADELPRTKVTRS